MAGICEGRVVVVTGAGRGLGRAHALAFAAEGAKVVVNDVGSALDGTGLDRTGGASGPAGEVVDAIRAIGGDAVVNADDVSSWDGAANIIATAVDTFGKLDVLVNNAGIVRDRMVVSMTSRHFSSGIVATSVSRTMPALFTRTSILPNAFRPASTAALTWASSPTSQVSPIARPPELLI